MAREVIHSDLPARNGVAVTPNDSTDLTFETRGLYVGGDGNIVVVMADQSDPAVTLTFTGVKGGSTLPYAVRRVYSTGTTATSINALW